MTVTAIRKKGTQKNLPGMAPKKRPVVQRAIKAYCDARDTRMDAGKVEVEKSAALLGVMKNLKIKSYNVDGYSANIVEGELKVKAKVKVADE